MTRDLVANVAPLTAFTALIIWFFAPAQVFVITLFRDYLLAATAWTFILALIIYLAVGWFVGTVVAFTANFMQRMISCLPGPGQKCSYTYWYKKDAKDIDALYEKLFPNYQYLASGAAVTPTDKVNVLKEYFRKYNPEGYSETYRQFMKVDAVRASMFYSAAILAYECYLLMLSLSYASHDPSWVLVFICGFVLLMSLVELPRRVRKVVRAEYLFIIATARIRDDQREG